MLEHSRENVVVTSFKAKMRSQARVFRAKKSWIEAWPLLISIRCLGVIGGPWSSSKYKANYSIISLLPFNLWRWLIFLILHLAMLFNLTQVFISENTIWRGLSGLLRSIVSTTTANVIAYNEETIRQTIQWCFERRYGSSVMLKVSVLFTLYSWTWACLALSIWIAIMVKMDLESAFRLYYFGISPTGISRSTAYIFVAIELTLNTFLNHCVMAFSLSLYIVLCYGTKRRISKMGRNMIWSLKWYGFEALAFIRKNRTDILDHLERLDGVMSKLLFLWYCYFMFLVCFDVTNLIQAEGDAQIIRVRYYIVYRCTTFILWFVALTLAAASVHEEDNALKFNVERWVSRQTFTEPKWYGEFLCLVNFFQEIPISMTAWKFFLIRRKVLLTIPGTIITYMVIMFQFNPKVMGVING